MHRILMPDGTGFKLNEKYTEPTTYNIDAEYSIEGKSIGSVYESQYTTPHLRCQFSLSTRTANTTAQQALTIYATAKRERINQRQQSGHLSMGGFVYEKDAKIKGNLVDTTKAGNLPTNYCGYDDQNEVYWQIDEWEHMHYDLTENYSKFGNLYDAIDNGNSSSIQAAIRELLAHGVKLSTIKGQLTKRYGSSEILNGYVSLMMHIPPKRLLSRSGGVFCMPVLLHEFYMILTLFCAFFHHLAPL